MDWKPDKSRPLCPQICEQLCLEIAEGAYSPEERLPSVREIAFALGVNPNTVQHAMEQLDGQGILYSVRGSGWYVQPDISRAKAVLQEIRQERIAAFFRSMQSLGMSPEETKDMVKEWQYE